MAFETREIDFLDYETWVGKSAGDVLTLVKSKNGWAEVYPEGVEVPMWLSRVRNFFNQRPRTIKRLGQAEAQHIAMSEQSGAALGSKMGPFGYFAQAVAVYKDEAGRGWFQTPPAGTIFHSYGEPGYGKMARNTIGGQSVTETFKLLRFDGTGGSSELILRNTAAWLAHNNKGNVISRMIDRNAHGGGRDFAGKTGEIVRTQGMSIVDERYAASYNFGDFYCASDATHKRFDVKTHSIQRGFYLNVNQYTPLAHRFFPKNWKGIPIFESHNHFSYKH